MSKLMKRIVLGIIALVVAGGLGYGAYKYVNHNKIFQPVETPMTETEEPEVSIGE